MVDRTHPPKRKIFLSYRRADHPDFVERIRDWFAWQYGRDSVFMDFDTIPPFTRFANFIREKVRECDVLVAIIGPSWLDLLQQRMNDSEEDYVRIEIRLALEEGKPIAPISIKDAPAPRRRELPSDLQAMMDYNVAYLTSGRSFLDNIERTVNGIEELLARIDMFQSVTQDIQVFRPPEFDVQHAILNFQDAADREDWYVARDWLRRIRHSGFMPRFYPIEDYEHEVGEAIEHLESERDYNVIRSMAERAANGRENPNRVLTALQTFWQSHPAYDPDDLASRFRPAQMAQKMPIQQGESIGKKRAVKDEGTDNFELAFLRGLTAIDTAAADALFDPDNLASIAHQLNQYEQDEQALSLDQAEALGIQLDENS
jgi:hypothetical protein